MPEVNISETELAELRQAHALLKSLYGDSNVGFEFRKLVKKKFPTASMPELEAVTKTEELGTDLTKRFGEMETSLTKKIDQFFADRKKEKEDADVERFATRVQKVVKDRGYTKEGQDKLLETMKERGIQNPEDAAVIFEAGQPKLERKKREFSTRMQFVAPEGNEDAQFNKLMNDPEQFMMDEMLSALNPTGTEEE